MHLTFFIATRVSIITSDTSSNPYRSPSQAYRKLRYRVQASDKKSEMYTHAFGMQLKPRYIFGAETLI